MRTEEEVKKELAELSDKFDLLKGDTNEMWRFWEEDKKLRDELEAIQNAKAEEEFNTPEAIEERKKEWKARQIKNIMQSGIGRRYLNADIKSFICKSQEQKEILKTVKQFISNPFGKSLWLVGVP